MRCRIDYGQVLVLTVDTAFAGWSRYNLFWDEIPFMNMFFLLEPSREKDYGRQLVLAWESTMKDRGDPGVMTASMAEKPAQHFYRKLSYRDIGSFFSIGDDRLELMFAKKF